MTDQDDLEKFLTARPRETVEIELRSVIANAPTMKARLRILTVHEHSLAASRAREYIDSFKQSNLSPEVETNACAAYAMQQAFVRVRPEHSDIKHDAPVFANGRVLMETLTADELAILFNLYQEAVAKFSPMAAALPNAEVDSLSETLAVCAEQDMLSFGMLARYSPDQLREIIIRLSLRIHGKAPSDQPTGSE